MEMPMTTLTLVGISLAFVPFALGHLPSPPKSDVQLDSGRILILGDSITQAGGYVSFLQYFLDKSYPTKHFDMISIGLASETVTGLSESIHPFPRPNVHDRLWAALDVVKPKVVMACYGMNDGIYHPFDEGRFKSFKAGILKLLAIDKAAGTKTILITPPPFDPVAAGPNVVPASASDFSYIHPFDHYDDVVKQYGEWEKSLSGPDVQVIDVHVAILNFVREQRLKNPTYTVSGDGVHINETGHWIMGKTIATSLGMPQRSKAVEMEQSDILKDPLFALVAKRRELRSNAWLPYVGYVRDQAFKKESVDLEELEAKRLQAEIDQIRK